MRVETESEVTYKVRCLNCNKGEWIVSEYHAKRFVESGDIFRWSCHTCGHEYTFKIHSLNDVEIEPTGTIHTPVWDVLYIDGTNPPIYAVHGTREVVPYEDDEDRYNKHRYYYEEHTCPTNILRVDG